MNFELASSESSVIVKIFVKSIFNSTSIVEKMASASTMLVSKSASIALVDMIVD